MGSPTFQPRFGEDRYPIGRFILERARALGISRSDLVRRLHYLDISSGHRALSAALLTGVVATHITNHLADALEAGDALVESVISATTRQNVMNHTCDGSRVNKPTATHSDRICRCRQSTQRLHRFSWRRC
jgi:hypothetical protein